MYYKMKVIKNICFWCKNRKNNRKNIILDLELSVYVEFMYVKMVF